MWLVIGLYILPLTRLASWRATTVMRLSSQSPMSRLWEKNSPVFLPPLQPGSPPAFGSIASTPQWRVGTVGLPPAPHAPDQPVRSSIRNIPPFLLCQMIHLKLGQGDQNFPKWHETSLGNIYLRSTFSPYFGHVLIWAKALLSYTAASCQGTIMAVFLRSSHGVHVYTKSNVFHNFTSRWEECLSMFMWKLIIPLVPVAQEG